MVPIAVGATAAEADGRLRRMAAVFPRLPGDVAAWRAAGFLYGTPDAVVADLRRWAALGVGRVMLQYLDMDDLPGIALIAREVLPALR
jgi:alkanesulfonate monooxygenase SsuD/methylene tetrahydromethanopterin reductase-like flavin-dependent oxidoreductase (luciferase family)